YLLAHYGRYENPQRSLGLFLSLACANHHDYRALPGRDQRGGRARQGAVASPYADCTPMAGAEPALVQHAWVRGIGDHHFDQVGDLDQAIAAYNKVAEDPAAELHAEALYKLAWSFYRRDLPLEAIKRFDRS